MRFFYFAREMGEERGKEEEGEKGIQLLTGRKRGVPKEKK